MLAKTNFDVSKAVSEHCFLFHFLLLKNFIGATPSRIGHTKQEQLADGASSISSPREKLHS
jgi:hypothetical protein